MYFPQTCQLAVPLSTSAWVAPRRVRPDSTHWPAVARIPAGCPVAEPPVPVAPGWATMAMGVADEPLRVKDKEAEFASRPVCPTPFMAYTTSPAAMVFFAFTR